MGYVLKIVRYLLGATLVLVFSLVAVSLVIGWLLPVADTCLDSGGSYNYETCACDYEKSYPYKEVHQCK
jgi:hypothetical protein